MPIKKAMGVVFRRIKGRLVPIKQGIQKKAAKTKQTARIEKKMFSRSIKRLKQKRIGVAEFKTPLAESMMSAIRKKSGGRAKPFRYALGTGIAAGAGYQLYKNR